MLYITLPEREWYSDEAGFQLEPALEVCLEHSLLAIFRWESKWKKPFLSLLAKKDAGLSSEELLDYMGHMIVEPPVYPHYQSIISRFSPENIRDILLYIDDPQTATVIHTNMPNKLPKRNITAELVYYWMIACGISKEYETWNYNRLQTLINIVGIESNPNKKKMSANDAAAMHRQINERNRARLGTRG